jgi:hypothetical protein
MKLRLCGVQYGFQLPIGNLRSILSVGHPAANQSICQPEVRSSTSLHLTTKLSNPTTSTVKGKMATTTQNTDADALIKSHDPKRQFYTFGWVTGTGGGVSIKHEDHIFLAPSGVEKEMMQPDNIFVMDYASKEYIRRPLVGSRQKEQRKIYTAAYMMQCDMT